MNIAKAVLEDVQDDVIRSLQFDEESMILDSDMDDSNTDGFEPNFTFQYGERRQKLS